ncbi:DUF3164 family protein [Pseudodesulfovibrio sp. JC047]|uniref:DUF3164 family protein n=1 Tax=Pseudodesulfovibrio sp. JC047 TaxID=2683199 RepID=UPI0013D2AEC6|nr:DUF3164 family protein [Pseudodesulfovibrio sp. JC047]NDV21018.1 DUF3164 family protein [Pseudodesulfovibrio sp. JC047]
MNSLKNDVPKGYMKNAQDHLVPMDQVKDIDKARDELVLELVGKFKRQQEALRKLKMAALDDIEAFIQLSGEQYGVSVGGKKGNVTLRSYDGNYEIKRQISEHLSFDEQLQAAKELIDECIKEWTEGSRTEIQALINDAFQVDKEGRINTSRILGLRRLNIKDERWLKAMDAIGNSLTIVGSTTYVRAYERGEHGKPQSIALDMASA